MVSINTAEHQKNNLIRIFVKGGMIRPENLKSILEASAILGSSYILFGSREDILIPPASPGLEEARLLLAEKQIDFEQGGRDTYQNIVSSAIASGITSTTQWLSPDHYHFILDRFTYRPRLKINITDPKQAMVPLFTGYLNFIASTHKHYWHLYIRPDQQVSPADQWPALVHSADIARLSHFIEERLERNSRYQLAGLVAEVASQIRIRTLTATESVALPPILFPYYEGMNNIDENSLWLGLYWRNNQFDTTFLREACELCIKTGIPYIYISPWKSFVIKHIKQQDQLTWERVMGQMGINMRHSSLELNWHIPVLDEEALALKRYLVRELDQQDICTHGLTFTATTAGDKGWFTSIVIQQEQTLSSNPQQQHYSLYYAKDFNPQTTIFYPYARQVKKEIIPSLLIELSKLYYQSLSRS